MTHIVLDEEQAMLIVEAGGSVAIRNAHGKHLGFVAPHFTDEDIAIAKQRLASSEPRRTTPQVLDRL